MNDIERVAREFSSSAKREGRSWRTTCPVCGGANLILSAGNRLPIVGHCKSKGCSVLQRIKEVVGTRPAPKRKASEGDEEGKTNPFPILQAADEATHGAWPDYKPTIRKPDKYLRGRGIKTTPPAALMLPARDADRLTGKSFPAMVFPIIGKPDDKKLPEGIIGKPDDKKLPEGIIGAHLTFLTRDLDEKCAMASPRRIYGSAKGYAQLAEIDLDHPMDEPLIVGEGIESTLSAMQISGLPGVAALSTSGLKSFHPPSCAREIIIAADNDRNNAGQEAANELAKRLAYEGYRVSIALPPEPDTDWNDVLMQSGADAKAIWRDAVGMFDGDDGEDSTDDENFALDKADFLALTFPKRDHLLVPWLPIPGLAMIHALRGEAKTWLALSISNAVAGNETLLGWKTNGFRRVLYVDGELPGSALQERLRQLPSSPPGMFHVLCRDRFHLERKMMPDLADEEGRDQIDRIIEKIKPDLIVLDSISTLVRRGTENEAESWQPIQDWSMKHRWHGRTIILIHHSGKSGQQRGTSKHEDTLDTVVNLRKRSGAGSDDDKNESSFELHFTKARDFYGSDAQPLLLYLRAKDGQMVWRHKTMYSEQERRIDELRRSGMKQKDIAREMKLSAARISQIIQKQARDGNVIKGPWAGSDQDN